MFDTRPDIVVDYQFVIEDKEELRRIEEERARAREELRKFRKATERYEDAVYSSDITETRLNNMYVGLDLSQRVH